mgnify:CR=1 FL=1
MTDKEIEKNIEKEFGNILETKDEDIKKLSFLESCIYLENLNKINERMKELKSQESE